MRMRKTWGTDICVANSNVGLLVALGIVLAVGSVALGTAPSGSSVDVTPDGTTYKGVGESVSYMVSCSCAGDHHLEMRGWNPEDGQTALNNAWKEGADQVVSPVTCNTCSEDANPFTVSGTAALPTDSATGITVGGSCPEDNSHGTDNESSLVVVKVTDLDVTGATYNSTTDKWYCSKDDPEPTITATIEPAVSAGSLPSGFMQWSVTPTTTLTKSTELAYTLSTSTAHEFDVKVKAGENGSIEEEVTIVVMETGWVEFDCTMTNNAASSVVTATGDEPIYNCVWNDGAPKTKVYFDYNPDQTTYVRVNASSATSANNSVELDGSGVRPSGDNYSFTITP